MSCPHCSSGNISNRSRLTSLGYKTFYCNECHCGFNERTGSPFNRSQLKTEIIFEVVLWRLRFKLSLQDLCEMFGIRGNFFKRETIRHWEEKYAPIITEDLKKDRKGKANKRWKADETMLKVRKKFYYLYRAIDNNGQLVDVKLSEVRDLESTSAFFKQAVETVGHKPVQVTSDKNSTYPGAIEKVLGKKVEHRTGQYRNNRLEQTNRWIKGRYKPMQGFKNSESAERFCQAFEEQRNFFKFQRWYNDYRSAGWKRSNFKSKYLQLKHKFMGKRLMSKQSVMLV